MEPSSLTVLKNSYLCYSVVEMVSVYVHGRFPERVEKLFIQKHGYLQTYNTVVSSRLRNPS